MNNMDAQRFFQQFFTLKLNKIVYEYFKNFQDTQICFPEPYNTEYFKTLNPLYEVASGFAKTPVYSAHKVKWRSY